MLDPKPDRFQRLLTVYTQFVPNSLNLWLDNLLLSLSWADKLADCGWYCSPFGKLLPAVVVVKGQREFHVFSMWVKLELQLTCLVLLCGAPRL